MDDQDTLRTYGNRNLPEGTEDRPLVTFALFAYNQEKYIREAVEGAFSQTYSPLEIILSDDCSSDRTFEIINDMAEAYEGSARVIIRKSSRNDGVLMHFRRVLDVSKGSYIIVAAGDDISLPNRSKKLIAMMISEGSKFAFSNYNEINEDGLITGQNISGNIAWTRISKIVKPQGGVFAIGATAAYRRDFLEDAFSSCNDTISKMKIYNEDELLSYYSVAIDAEPSQLKEGALVLYRKTFGSLSHPMEKNYTISGEKRALQREIFYCEGTIALMHALLEMAGNTTQLQSRVNWDKVHEELHCSNLMLILQRKSTFKRLKIITEIRSVADLRIVAPRLLGLTVLAFIRYCRDRMRKSSQEARGIER